MIFGIMQKKQRSLKIFLHITKSFIMRKNNLATVLYDGMILHLRYKNGYLTP